MQKNDEMDKLRKIMEWDQLAVDEWVGEIAKRDEDQRTLMKYEETDDVRLKVREGNGRKKLQTT